MQHSLNNLESYCNKWNLTVNIDNTKIVVFRKDGLLGNDLQWTYGDKAIELVNSFNYLGLVLSSGGSFMQATNTLCGKGLRAMHALFNLTRDIVVPIDIMFNLFDAYVISVLNYSCEVWGFIKAENIEEFIESSVNGC